ncbi:MAG TPA: hypothetical protein VK348_11455 [Planctomycetota bacterium]|nr:hypothetical protein [Planctomycetota bacterium]
MQRWLVAGLPLLFGAPSPAQEVETGALAPAVHVDEWLLHGPVELAAGARPKLLVLAAYDDLDDLREHADHLHLLQLRLHDRGLQVVALLGNAPAPLAIDPQWSFAIGRVDGMVAEPLLQLSDGSGTVLWCGRPEHGLLTAAATALDGKLDPAVCARDAESRQNLCSGLDDLPAADLQPQIAQLLLHNPQDGIAWALQYLVQTRRLGDVAAARQTLAAAGRELAAAPAALGAFADLALRADRHDRQTVQALLPVLTQTAPAAGGDSRLQLAVLRALVRGGHRQEIKRRAERLRAAFDHRPEQLLQLAEILADEHGGKDWAVVAGTALARAEQLQADPRSVVAVRYRLLRNCSGDAAAAARLLASHTAELGGDTGVNNDAWYLMTELPTMGRFDDLAIALCDQLLLHRDRLEAFELDTCALGRWLAGDTAAAVELEATAATRDGSRGSYEERLQVYRSALARGR